MKVEAATYSPCILPEHRGNPLIEALPAKVTDETLIQKLSYYPDWSPEEQLLSSFERVEYLTRLKDLRQPLPLYLKCFRAIEIAIKEGYSSKNPTSPTTQNFLHYLHTDLPSVAPTSGFFKPKGSGITVIGESGVGKTCMLEQILSCFPDAIEHDQYNNAKLNFRQVVWLKVECPEDSSVRGLCHRILTELDIKESYPPTKPASTIAALLGQIEARIKSSFLGILVIDEMQNLDLAKAGGAERLLGFLHSIVNNLGIPILFCANPPFDKLLRKTLKTARRAENSGYFNVNLMDNDEIWELFIESLWELQWTNSHTPMNQELSDTLYQLSVGNMDLAVRIFREAQRCIIGSGDERISKELLKYAATNVLKASSEVVEEIRQKKDAVNKLKEQRQENRKHDERNDSFGARAETGQTEDKSYYNEPTVSDGNFQTIPGDLTRPQHPEFARRLQLIQQSKRLEDLVQDPDLIQRIMDSDTNSLELENTELFYRHAPDGCS
jgi:hypothetical protein